MIDNLLSPPAIKDWTSERKAGISTFVDVLPKPDTLTELVEIKTDVKLIEDNVLQESSNFLSTVNPVPLNKEVLSKLPSVETKQQIINMIYGEVDSFKNLVETTNKTVKSKNLLSSFRLNNVLNLKGLIELAKEYTNITQVINKSNNPLYVLTYQSNLDSLIKNDPISESDIKEAAIIEEMTLNAISLYENASEEEQEVLKEGLDYLLTISERSLYDLLAYSASEIESSVERIKILSKMLNLVERIK